MRTESRLKFQRHSITRFSGETIAIKRNGGSFRSGNFFIAVEISSEVDIPISFLMTSPRLRTPLFGSRLMRCQLIKTKHTAASFAEIKVHRKRKSANHI